ncbi:transcription initiation factor IIB [Coemansia sp. RSA 552]|nr:transcription initiation factor IIB [Coemansia sp. RSA 552]
MPSTELAAPTAAAIDTGFAAAASSSSSSRITALCPDCRNVTPNLVHDYTSGSLLCADCNTVVGDRLIEPPGSWRQQQQQQRRAEDDARLLMSAAGFSLRKIAPRPAKDVVSSSTTDSREKAEPMLARAMRSRTHSRAVQQQRQERQERNLRRAYGEIASICALMDLPAAVVETARDLYRRVDRENLHKGKSSDAVVGTCIFLACRQKALPRTFKEICALTKVPRKDIGRMFKLLKERLGATASPVSSDDLMMRFCANLSLLASAQDCAVLLNQMAKQQDTLAGRSPVSVAAACIYMASHLVAQPRDAKVISHVAGISEVTIKNSYKLLFADRLLLVSDQVLAACPAASLGFLPVP